METVYRANDGAIFRDQKECLYYEVRLDVRDKIIQDVSSKLDVNDGATQSTYSGVDVSNYILSRYDFLYPLIKSLMDADYQLGNLD